MNAIKMFPASETAVWENVVVNAADADHAAPNIYKLSKSPCRNAQKRSAKSKVYTVGGGNQGSGTGGREAGVKRRGSRVFNKPG